MVTYYNYTNLIGITYIRASKLSRAPMGGGHDSEYRKLVYAGDRYNDNTHYGSITFFFFFFFFFF